MLLPRAPDSCILLDQSFNHLFAVFGRISKSPAVICLMFSVCGHPDMTKTHQMWPLSSLLPTLTCISSVQKIFYSTPSLYVLPVHTVTYVLCSCAVLVMHLTVNIYKPNESRCDTNWSFELWQILNLCCIMHSTAQVNYLCIDQESRNFTVAMFL